MTRPKAAPPRKARADWIHLQQMRALRHPGLYYFPRRRPIDTAKLLGSLAERILFFEDRLQYAILDRCNANDLLNVAMAELVFGRGVETVARQAGLNSKSLYRAFSFTEKRRLSINTVDRVLRTFDLKLAVVALDAAEMRQEKSKIEKRGARPH